MNQNLDIEKLFRDIELDRRADDCGPGCNSRASAKQIIRKAFDKFRVALRPFAEMWEELLRDWPDDEDEPEADTTLGLQVEAEHLIDAAQVMKELGT